MALVVLLLQEPPPVCVSPFTVNNESDTYSIATTSQMSTIITPCYLTAYKVMIRN